MQRQRVRLGKDFSRLRKVSGHLSPVILSENSGEKLRHCRTGSVGHRNRNGRSAPKYVPVRGTLDRHAPNQIAEAKRLSAGMEISYLVSPAEELDFAGKQFDCITACQCYWYFDNQKAAPVFARLLKPHGELLLLCMEWLPYSDKIAEASEKLVLQYNPKWSGAGETKHPISVAPELLEYFDLTYHEEYELDVSFTRTSWNGRMKACRGIGASLTPEEIAAWEKEHLQLLERIAPETFLVRHYAAIAELRKK